MNRSLIIAGMHRSGTSALAGALSALGVEFGPQLMPANQQNPKGYFEHIGIYQSHELLLAKLSRSWSDLRLLPENWVNSCFAQECRLALKDLLEKDFSNFSLWAVKDPRLCRLLPLWIPMLDEMSINVSFLIPIRHPAEVAESLFRRDRMDHEQGSLLWLLHLLEVERATRGFPRMFVLYRDLLADPCATMTKIGDELQIDWPKSDFRSVLNEAVESGLRHNFA